MFDDRCVDIYNIIFSVFMFFVLAWSIDYAVYAPRTLLLLFIINTKLCNAKKERYYISILLLITIYICILANPDKCSGGEQRCWLPIFARALETSRSHWIPRNHGVAVLRSPWTLALAKVGPEYARNNTLTGDGNQWSSVELPELGYLVKVDLCWVHKE